MRHRTLSAVMLFLTRTQSGGKQILLQRRKNTGYCDGMWDSSVSGHVDEGESMKMAVVREAWEELGIRIAIDDIAFLALIHSNRDTVYYNAYFTAEAWEGVPGINEPEKCSELGWFPADSLPEDLIPDRRKALELSAAGIPYGEEAWPYLEE